MNYLKCLYVENANVYSYAWLETTCFIVEPEKVPNFSNKISITITEKL